MFIFYSWKRRQDADSSGLVRVTKGTQAPFLFLLHHPSTWLLISGSIHSSRRLKENQPLICVPGSRKKKRGKCKRSPPSTSSLPARTESQSPFPTMESETCSLLAGYTAALSEIGVQNKGSNPGWCSSVD